jgi:hypothetical protein
MGHDPGRWRGVFDGRYVYSRGRYRVLYDYEQDPYEQHNLRGEASSRALEGRLSKVLIELADELGDPLYPELVAGRQA